MRPLNTPLPDQPHLFLTLSEVADRYRVELRTVEGWRYRGIGPKAVKIGGRVLFPIHELMKFEEASGL